MASTSGPLSVLIVDDEPAARRLLRETLADVLGGGAFAAREAASADEALAAAAESAPDLVFTDYLMTGASGIDLLEALCTACPGSIRVLVTAHGDARVAQDALLRGKVHAFIPKGAAPDEVARVLSRLLDRER